MILFGSRRWGSLVGFSFSGAALFLIMYYLVAFTVFYMFQIYQDLDVAFSEKPRQCCLRSKQRKQLFRTMARQIKMNAKTGRQKRTTLCLVSRVFFGMAGLSGMPGLAAPPIRSCIPPRPFSRKEHQYFSGRALLAKNKKVLTSFDGFYYR